MARNKPEDYDGLDVRGVFSLPPNRRAWMFLEQNPSGIWQQRFDLIQTAAFLLDGWHSSEAVKDEVRYSFEKIGRDYTLDDFSKVLSILMENRYLEDYKSIKNTLAAATRTSEQPVEAPRKGEWNGSANWERRMQNYPNTWEQNLLELEEKQRRESEAQQAAAPVEEVVEEEEEEEEEQGGANMPMPGAELPGFLKRLFGRGGKRTRKHRKRSSLSGKHSKKSRKASKKSRKGKGRKH